MFWVPAARGGLHPSALETKFYPYRLTEYSEGVEETFDFVGGHWTTDLTITLSEQASGFVQSVGQPLTVEGEKVLLDSVYLSPIAAFYGIRPSGDDPFSDPIWEVMISSNDASTVLTTQSGETVRMAEQVYGRAAGETETVSYGMFERTYAVCLSGPMRFRDARLPEWDTARSGSLTRRKLPLSPSLDRPSPWTGWFRWNHRNKGGTSRPCFSRTTEKQKATAFAVAFCFGGERGIRTLERVLAVTRFPIVRLRPAQPSLQTAAVPGHS